jgi:hypothetical protein
MRACSRGRKPAGSRRPGFRRIVATAVIALIAAACGSDAVTGPDDDVPVGLRIHLNGALVARVDGADIDGFLHVHVGEYSGQFIVTAVNGAGNSIDTPGTFRLAASMANPGIAAFVQPSQGALEGEIVAETGGATHLTLELWRGDAATGSLAFAAPPIEVLAIVCPGGGQPQSASFRASATRRATMSPSLTTCAPRTRP